MRPRPARTSVRRWIAPALCIAAGAAQAAGPAEYELDPVHTRVLFAVSHAGFSSALGTVSGSSGRIRFDPDDWSSASLDVQVPLQRIDLGDADWTAAVLAPNLLDAARQPQARFVSTAVEALDPRHARVCGDLTLHGTTRPQCLDVVFNQLRRHPLPPFRRTAGFSATGSLSRKAFGIGAWPTVIGDEVQLRIEAEAVRAHAEAVDAAGPESSSPQDTDRP